MKCLVNEVKKQQSIKARIISTDRLYNSISFANWLLSIGIATVGTLNTNLVSIRKELEDVRGKKELSITCHFELECKNVCLVTYSVKAMRTGLRNVLVLTNTRPIHGVTKDNNKKTPAIIKLDNFTKGEKNKADQLND